MRFKANVQSILSNPKKEWKEFVSSSRGGLRTAFREINVDWEVYNNKDYLFTHDSIVASVATEEDGFTIKEPCWEIVNANGNAWTNDVLLHCYKTFIGGENYCFPEGQRVLMSNGTYKNIKDVKVGDEVINAKGEVDKVTKTFVHKSKNFSKFKSFFIYNRELICTRNHPFYVYQDRGTCANTGKAISCQRIGEYPKYNDVGLAPGQRQGFGLGKGKTYTSRWGHPVYKKAEEITPERNLFITPICKTIIPNFEINLKRARLIGWFLAEGCYNSIQGISFSVSSKELHILKDLQEILETEFPSFDKKIKYKEPRQLRCKIYTEYYKGKISYFNLEYNGREAEKFLREWCGEYSWAKQLKKDFLYLPLDIQMEMLKALYAGDGHEPTEERGGLLELKSKPLIQQVCFILTRFGIQPVYKEVGVLPRYSEKTMIDGYEVYFNPTNGEKSRPGYLVHISNKDWKKFNPQKPFKHGRNTVIFEDKNIVSRFKKEDFDLDEEIPVYNIEVENDHSYIVEGIAVHNCEHIQIPSLSKGKILDAVIRETTHKGEKIYVVDILVATNRIHKSLVERIERGELNTMSMGATATFVQCSVCGKIIDTIKGEPLCEHLEKNLGKEIYYNGKKKFCAELCGAVDPKTKEYIPDSCTFIEASWVEQPAYEGAVTNFLIETPEIKKSRQEKKALEDYFSDSLFGSLRVADRKGKIALKLTREFLKMQKINTIAHKIALNL